jgi:hypothetical protein
MEKRPLIKSMIVISVFIVGLIFLQSAGFLPAQEQDRIKEELFQEAREALSRAEKEDIKLFSPENFYKAFEFYNKALSEYEKGERLERIRENIRQSVKYFNEAFEVTKLSRIVLEQLIQIRDNAVESKIHITAKERFDRADNRFKEASEKIEKGDVKSAQQIAGRVEKEYRDAAVEAMKTELVNFENKLDRIKKEIARELLQSAEIELDAIEEFLKSQSDIDFKIGQLCKEVRDRIGQIFVMTGMEPEAEAEKEIRDKGIVNLIEIKLQETYSYHLLTKRNDGTGYVSKSEVDAERKAVHTIINLGTESRRKVEYYWIGKSAYGYPAHMGKWFQLWVPCEPVSRLHGLFGMLKTGKITSDRKDFLAGEMCHVLSVIPDHSSLRNNPGDYTSYLFADSQEHSKQDEENRKRVEEAMKQAEIRAEFWISSESYNIMKVVLKTRVIGIETAMAYRISKVNDSAINISFPNEVREAIEPPVPLGALFMHVSDFN